MFISGSAADYAACTEPEAKEKVKNKKNKIMNNIFFFFSSRRRHTRWNCDWSSDVCSSDLATPRHPGARRSGLSRKRPGRTRDAMDRRPRTARLAAKRRAAIPGRD